MRRWRNSHAAWRAACLPICQGHHEGDDDDDNHDDNESHMSSTVYLVEASWVGGTILRCHQKSSRHVANMIYEKFTEDLQSDLRDLLHEIYHKIDFGRPYVQNCPQAKSLP